jgi:hypothetical protein
MKSSAGSVRSADDTGVDEEDLASTDLQGRQIASRRGQLKGQLLDKFKRSGNFRLVGVRCRKIVSQRVRPRSCCSSCVARNVSSWMLGLIGRRTGYCR